MYCSLVKWKDQLIHRGKKIAERAVSQGYLITFRFSIPH